MVQVAPATGSATSLAYGPNCGDVTLDGVVTTSLPACIF